MAIYEPKAHYAVRTRDGLYAIYGAGGASEYLGVVDAKPAGLKNPPRDNPRKAEAMRMDAYKRNAASKRYGGTDAMRGDGTVRGSSAMVVFEKLGARR